jgi:hypothetical protein
MRERRSTAARIRSSSFDFSTLPTSWRAARFQVGQDVVPRPRSLRVRVERLKPPPPVPRPETRCGSTGRRARDGLGLGHVGSQFLKRTPHRDDGIAAIAQRRDVLDLFLGGLAPRDCRGALPERWQGQSRGSPARCQEAAMDWRRTRRSRPRRPSGRAEPGT